MLVVLVALYTVLETVASVARNLVTGFSRAPDETFLARGGQTLLIFPTRTRTYALIVVPLPPGLRLHCLLPRPRCSRNRYSDALGPHKRKVTHQICRKPQRYFNEGLAFSKGSTTGAATRLIQEAGASAL